MPAIRLDMEWRTTALVVVLLPALIALGFWQLDRAQEKRAIASLNDERMALPPAALDSLIKRGAEAYAGRRVRLSGHFSADAVLFSDNQIRDGRYGHDVYGVFRDEQSGSFVLVNRGWVAGDASRRSLPTVSAPVERVELEGRIYVPPGEPYMLAQEAFDSLTFPLLVQSVDSAALFRALETNFNAPFFAHEVRLTAEQGESSQDYGFRRDWPVINVSPQKHQGYALQWFTMAAALLIFFIVRSSNIVDVIRRSDGVGGRSDQE